jgi:hypothetical protein
VIKNVVQTHVASGYCCHTVSEFKEYETAPLLYSDEDVMSDFFQHILREHDRISSILSINKPLKPLTDEKM